MENKAKKYYYFTLYQLCSETLLVALLFAFGSITKLLLNSTGQSNASNTQILHFIASVPGILFIGFALLLLALCIAIDIHSFLYLSLALHKGEQKISLFAIFKQGILALRKYRHWNRIVLILFFSFVVPLLSIGIRLQIMENFAIPSFIFEVIQKKPLYYILYITVLVLAFCVSIFYFFVFHYLLFGKENNIFQKAGQCMRQNWKAFLKNIGIIFVKHMALVVLAVLFLFVFCMLPAYKMVLSNLARRIFLCFVFISVSALLSILLLFVPSNILHQATHLFLQIEDVEYSGKAISKKGKSYRFKMTCIAIVGALGIAAVSVICGVFFEEIFRSPKNIAIVAHRAGGTLGVENSLTGLQKAIEHNIPYSEIDIQRSKDGKYYVHHDNTLQRLAGSAKAIEECNTEELQTLQIQDDFGKPEALADLTQVLRAGKDRIHLLIECKGKTADTKMIDDVVQMLEQEQMQSQCTLLSLDLSLLEYSKSKYPHIQTGYLYYASLGDISKISADILLMEEQLATDTNIERIQMAGKQAFVWTVNNEDAMRNFLQSNVDGIISDEPLQLQDLQIQQKNKDDLELLLDTVF